MQLKAYLQERRGRAIALARKCGVHPSTITRIANGEVNPSLNLMRLIAEHTEDQVRVADFAEPALAGER